MPKPTKNNWEKEFDERFIESKYVERIKQFIHQLLKQEKEKLLERIGKRLKEIPINYYKGKGFERKGEPLIEESKIKKLLEKLKEEIKNK